MLLLGIAIGVTAQVTAVEMNVKASKEARKEAKRFKKEKWQSPPGGMSIERQLDRYYLLEYDTDLETGQSNYAFGYSIATGQFYAAAKVQASELAKGDLIDKLHTEITREVTAVVKNKQLTEELAQSVAGIVDKSKSITIQSLNNLEPVLELYRKLKNGNVEVLVRYAYKRSKARNDTFRYVAEEARNQGIDLELVQ